MSTSKREKVVWKSSNWRVKEDTSSGLWWVEERFYFVWWKNESFRSKDLAVSHASDNAGCL